MIYYRLLTKCPRRGIFFLPVGFMTTGQAQESLRIHFAAVRPHHPLLRHRPTIGVGTLVLQGRSGRLVDADPLEFLGPLDQMELPSGLLIVVGRSERQAFERLPG